MLPCLPMEGVSHLSQISEEIVVQSEGCTLTKVGTYTLVKELGKGSKSTVFLARDSQERMVAVKVYLPKRQFYPELAKHYFDESGVSKLAQREWKLGKGLKHPNIVEIFDYFTETAEGEVYSYIVMEYIESAPSQELSKEMAVRLALGLCDALIYGLQQGYIHRDLYSDNMIVSKEGTLKLIDIDSFSECNGAFSHLDEVDSEGKAMDPLEGYLIGIGGIVSKLLRLGGVEKEFRSLIPPNLDRNIQKEDVSLIIAYLEAIQRSLVGS